MVTSRSQRAAQTVPRPRHSVALPPPGSAGTTLERAKGLLMFRHGLNSHQAFALLLQHAHDLGTDVAGAAMRVVDDAVRESAPPPSGQDRVRWMTAVAEAGRAVQAGSGSGSGLDRVLEVAVRAAGAERGVLVARRTDRPGTLQVLAAHGFPGMRGGATLPRREPWIGVMSAGRWRCWTGRLDPAEVSAPVDAVVVPFAASGEPGAMLVARSPDTEATWPDTELPVLLAAFAEQVSIALSARGIASTPAADGARR